MTTRPSLILLCACLALPAVAAASCDAGPARPVLPARDGVLPPVVEGLAPGPGLPQIQPAVLAFADTEAHALDRVLMRQRLSRCVEDEFADYVPRTEFDNTPYRFNMDSGKRFTAEEFDAWMKRRGIRIAKGKPGAAAADAAPAVATPAAATPVVGTEAAAPPAPAAEAGHRP